MLKEVAVLLEMQGVAETKDSCCCVSCYSELLICPKYSN